MQSLIDMLLASRPDQSSFPVAIAASNQTWQVATRCWAEVQDGQPLGGSIRVIRLVHASKLGVPHPGFVPCFTEDMAYAFDRMDEALRHPALARASPEVIKRMFDQHRAEYKARNSPMPLQSK